MAANVGLDNATVNGEEATNQQEQLEGSFSKRIQSSDPDLEIVVNIFAQHPS